MVDMALRGRTLLCELRMLVGSAIVGGTTWGESSDKISSVEGGSRKSGAK